MFASNVKCTIRACRHFAPGMEAAVGGSISTTSEEGGGGRRARRWPAAYGRRSVARAMARAGVEYGRAGRGAPSRDRACGQFYTPTQSGANSSPRSETPTPMHRASQPEEIARGHRIPRVTPTSELHHRRHRRRRVDVERSSREQASVSKVDVDARACAEHDSRRNGPRGGEGIGEIAPGRRTDV